MCGIAVAFGAGSTASEEVLSSIAREHLRHRGPDGTGVASSGLAVVAHTRLSIVDLLGGRQPMTRDDGRLVLACNGEIYNHRSLRRVLGKSSQFSSESDCEVVLHLYAAKGVNSLRELDGMFALFVTDGTRFLAARDPLGIKPLYFGRDSGGGIWFASELKALMTRCASVAALPPGSFIDESLSVKRYYEPSWARHDGVRWDVAPKLLLGRLEAAVVKRLMSDVPVGVLLSGGVDSSLVAALARPHVRVLQTFSVGLKGAPDLEAARYVARVLGTEHYERVYDEREVEAALEEVIYHLESYDAALIRSSLPCFFVSELASEHVKVVLTGEGADELFAGYSYMGQYADSWALQEECVRLLHGLHAMNLQRVDRMTMAHGIEGRVPFLDADFVAWAMSIDPQLKLWRSRRDEKRVLRAAAERVLPRAIARREKLEFSTGSASDLVLRELAERRVEASDMAASAARFPHDPPHTKEEYLYRSIFERLFPGDLLRHTVSRWRPNQALLS